MSNVTIRDVRVINTCPAGSNLTVVKVETSEPGLHGVGCATFTYRWRAVTVIVEEYLKPLLVGRDAANIEDIWHLMNANAYWRNGPEGNNAISGVDMALWDIKGKMANMPLYDLFGGKSREGVAVYRHADGRSFEEVLERVQGFIDQGVRHVRLQFGGYGGKPEILPKPDNAPDGIYYNPNEYFNNTIKIIDYIRSKVGFGIELLHDTHERIEPIMAVNLAKALEPYRLFFLEDLLSPEQSDWFRMIRAQCATPLSMGELWVNFKEWDYLIRERLIDFVRSHISAMGGVTPARKMAIFAEQFGIRTAWHGPGDVSPVGHAANVHLGMNSHNFGIQEWSGFREESLEVFPGAPELRRGYVYLNGMPGLGIDIDEEKAKKYPCAAPVTMWTQTRVTDGTYHTP